MKYWYKVYGIISLIVLLLPFTAKCQLTISELSHIPDLKRNGVFVALPAVGADKVKDIIQKNWTISKCKFIKIEDISKNMASDNFFLTISGWTHESRFSSGTTEHYHITFDLWTPNKSYLNSSRKKLPEVEDKIEVASFKLYADVETLYHPYNVYKPGFDPFKHIYNWQPGYIKNYITLFMQYLNSETEINLGFSGFSKAKPIINTEELAKLKDQTLYIPDYILLHYTTTVLDGKRTDEKDLLSDYTSKYKIISNSELSTKIMTETDPFYYFIYIKFDTNYKYLNIINSQTGEIIYSDAELQSYNLKEKDFSKLAEAMK